jgi:glycolate oxidase
LRRNRSALDAIAFRPKVLRDVSKVDCTGEIFGKRVRLPVILAPIGTQPYGGGPTAAAAAAKEFGCGYVFSSVNPQATIDEVVAAGPEGATIFQLDVRGDADWVNARIDQAISVGCAAFCVTVDTPVISRRERDYANRFTSNKRRFFDGADMQASFDWDKLAEMRERCTIPLIVKGIQDPEDADRAVGAGADAIYLSNHGGRQLDHALGAMEVLPEIVDAIAGRAKVMVDGGILRGSDIVKALALGADQVGIGKLFCLALAAGGTAGVVRMLELLEDEVELCLSLIGAPRFSDLDSSWVRPGRIEPAEGDFLRAMPLFGRNVP